MITLDAPSFVPVMQHVQNWSLREESICKNINVQNCLGNWYLICKSINLQKYCHKYSIVRIYGLIEIEQWHLKNWNLWNHFILSVINVVGGSLAVWNCVLYSKKMLFVFSVLWRILVLNFFTLQMFLKCEYHLYYQLFSWF